MELIYFYKDNNEPAVITMTRADIEHTAKQDAPFKYFEHFTTYYRHFGQNVRTEIKLMYLIVDCDVKVRDKSTVFETFYEEDGKIQSKLAFSIEQCQNMLNKYGETVYTAQQLYDEAIEYVRESIPDVRNTAINNAFQLELNELLDRYCNEYGYTKINANAKEYYTVPALVSGSERWINIGQ